MSREAREQFDRLRQQYEQVYQAGESGQYDELLKLIAQMLDNLDGRADRKGDDTLKAVQVKMEAGDFGGAQAMTPRERAEAALSKRPQMDVAKAVDVGVITAEITAAVAQERERWAQWASRLSQPIDPAQLAVLLRTRADIPALTAVPPVTRLEYGW